jgi:hypothetical protein
MARQGVPTVKYHSAHLPEEAAPALGRFDRDGSTALVWDITAGELPAEYEGCDVLYSEPPWVRGVDVFNARAGVSDVTFTAVMAGIAAIVESNTRPAHIVIGKQAVKRIPKPDALVPIQLNQWAALVAVYRTEPVPVQTSVELTAVLAARHERVGDFCCGYGRALRAFVQRGKKFTGSDYNPRCIGYIADHYGDWMS